MLHESCYQCISLLKQLSTLSWHEAVLKRYFIVPHGLIVSRCQLPLQHFEVAIPDVMISSPRDKEGLQAGRLGLSHWAGPSVTRSAWSMLPDMGLKCVTEAWRVWCVTQPGIPEDAERSKISKWLSLNAKHTIPWTSQIVLQNNSYYACSLCWTVFVSQMQWKYVNFPQARSWQCSCPF